MTSLPDTLTCAHCGRPCGDYDGGWATVHGHHVCHPNEAGRPDCYDLVTVQGQRIGLLNRPAPGRCMVRAIVDGVLVPCTEQGVHTETHTDPGCPDDPNDGPHVSELLYCAAHRHHASSTGSKS